MKNIILLKKLRQKIKKKYSLGSWIQIPDSTIAEIFGSSGYDWIALDLEHGAISINQIPDLARAIELGNSLAFARVPGLRLDEVTRILDAGTGIGNSAKLFSSNPKATIFAIDASESVIFAYKKYGNLTNVHFLQADIQKLPFKKGFFDFICSDQVLHHTKNTERSFKTLTKLLAKKGIISIYVYKIKGPMREFADTFILPSFEN